MTGGDPRLVQNAQDDNLEFRTEQRTVNLTYSTLN